MTVAKKIKMLLVEREMNLTDLAEKLGTTQPNLSNKMKRNNFRESEIAEIAKVLGIGYEINFILEDEKRI